MTVESDETSLLGELRHWLTENWDPDVSLVEWRSLLVDAKWACPSWPVDWFGRGLAPRFDAVVGDELAAMGAVGPAAGVGMALAAPTLLAHGSDALKEKYLRPTLTGAITWCQLFSEPGSGSDLASLSTRADRDGDDLVVSGQKVWNTGAHRADYGILLVRTRRDVPKHQGITCVVIDMHQPGIEVRPLKQMNGYASFNEVFLTDARVPLGEVVGDLDRGWTVALTTLANERRLASHGRVGGRRAPQGRVQREAFEEATIQDEPHRWYPQRAGRPDLLVEHARLAGVAGDPLIRQEITRVLSLVSTARWTAERARQARLSGRQPGPEGSLAKLSSSAIARAAAAAHAHIAGAGAMLSGPDSPLGGTIAEILVSVPGGSIAGGTDEIQHNIIGERVLGLPKEPDVSRDVAFEDLRR
ncbi:MAG: acyl-CoA dehydrogenase family protein [Acidimicrobiales bacterium]